MAKKEKVNIGISEKNRAAVVDVLQKLLADEFVLYTKTRNYHWNVQGMSFGVLHKFFEDQYTILAKVMDEVAERIRQLGHYSAGTLGEFLKTTRLKETTNHNLEARLMIQNLTADHESIIRSIHEAVGEVEDTNKDEGTADFITNIMEKHEKMAWMLRAHLA